MKYMLLVYVDEQLWGEGEWWECTVDSVAMCHELTAKGQLIAASPLHPVATAVSVRVRDGQRLVTKGPFAETTEQLGGYFIIDVPNLDEAIAIASRLPPAKKGTIEIRPVVELSGLPASKAHLPADGENAFMLICYDDQQFWKDAEKSTQEDGMSEAIELAHQIDASEQYLDAAPLHAVSTATSVRVRNGKRNVTDGPFAETREVLGGYYLVSVSDVEQAISIAAKHPGARVGTVEIRQIYDLHSLSQRADSAVVN